MISREGITRIFESYYDGTLIELPFSIMEWKDHPDLKYSYWEPKADLFPYVARPVVVYQNEESVLVLASNIQSRTTEAALQISHSFYKGKDMVETPTQVEISYPATEVVLPGEILSWLEENIGPSSSLHRFFPKGEGWAMLSVNSEYGNPIDHVVMGFDDPNKAMLFKLTWAGR